MSLFKNKHLVIAMIVTPILAILGFFAADAFVSEKPHKAIEGESYELVAKPNCRYTSGLCELKNGNFEISLTVTPDSNGLAKINLESSHPLKGAKLGIGDQQQPASFSLAEDQDQRKWFLPLAKIIDDDTVLRLAIKAEESVYYAQVNSIFIDKKTSFSKTF
ncbi:MAG: hypothetical protein ACRBHB_18515 [Arenicella sp.]